MSSRQGTRQRFPGKPKSEDRKTAGNKRELTEEEAVTKASNRWIVHFLLALALSLVTPILVLFLLPSPIQPKEFPSLTPPVTLDGPLSLSNELASAEKLFHNELMGPESMVFDGDYMYTGTLDGWVNSVYQGQVTRLVRFGQEPCGGFENENTCGRPLGLRMDQDGFLVVCDAYHGLFRVNVTSGEYETLYKAMTPVNGRASKFLNDLDIDRLGKIYFTDSSTEWHRNEFVHTFFEGDTSGRLLMFDPVTQTTTQLMGGLMFPNGIQLVPDQSAVLMAEFSRARILKYDLRLKKFSVWADGLPGNPDNIRYDEKTQRYWVGMGLVRYANGFTVLDYMATRPWLRGILAKVVTIATLPKLRSFINQFVLPQPQAMVVAFSQDGEIVDSVQDRKGEVIKHVSEVHMLDNTMYMGSYSDYFIGRLERRTGGNGNE